MLGWWRICVLITLISSPSSIVHVEVFLCFTSMFHCVGRFRPGVRMSPWQPLSTATVVETGGRWARCHVTVHVMPCDYTCDVMWCTCGAMWLYMWCHVTVHVMSCDYMDAMWLYMWCHVTVHVMWCLWWCVIMLWSPSDTNFELPSVLLISWDKNKNRLQHGLYATLLHITKKCRTLWGRAWASS